MVTRNLVFIDSRVSDYQSLLGNLSADTAWVLLDAQEDGVLQMQKALSSLSDLDSIQIVSHGSVGTLYLGSAVLDQSNLDSYHTALQAFGNSLTAYGDLLLYGCNVGAGELGQAFVNSLATITGAEVAASNNPTGRNGDWTLETSSGTIEAQGLSVPGYAAALDIITGTDGNDRLLGTNADDIMTGLLGNDTIHGGAGIDIAVFPGNSAGYRIGYSTGGVELVDIDVTDADTGTDFLTSIETLRFLDRDLTLGASMSHPLEEIRVNSTTASSQISPSVTGLSGGGYVITWASNLQDGSGWGIYLQRYDNNSVALGAETRVNTTTASHQYLPSVTALSNGGYVVTWTSDGQDGNRSGVYAQRYDSNGLPLGAESRINTTTTGDQNTSSVTELNGGYIVTWTSADGSGNGIYAQRYDNAGLPLGSETRINSTTANIQTDSSVTGLSGGGYIVTWQSYLQDGSGNGIYAQRYDSSGLPLGSETRINSTTEFSQIDPSVIGLSGGGYVVTWQSVANHEDIYAQRYDSNGVAQGTETLINSISGGNQFSPSGAALSDGGYVITWQSDEHDNSNVDIYQRRYDSNGIAQGTEIRVNSTTAGIQGYPSVSALSNGGYVITWESFGQDGSEYGIYSQSYDAAGIPASLDITGTASAEVINGGTGAQTLYGLDGNDTLDGGSGANVMVGGNGNDVYYVNTPGDVVTETNSAKTEIDTVNSGVNYTLGANLENLTLTGSAYTNATGNSLANYLTGNSGGNRLTGGAGKDTLDGQAGADLLTGGSGDDTYFVDDSDAVIELADGGLDTVNTIDSWTLDAYQENLNLTGDGASIGTGNNLANRINGNIANNILDGKEGADTMAGGLGNDTYIVDNTADSVIEDSALSTEIDTIVASASFILGPNLENLSLSGPDAIDATGNSLDNILSGNADENILNGMTGLDTVSYENAASRVEVSLTITGYQNTLGDGFDKLVSIENLTGSAFNDKFTGNARANRLEGEAGDDTLIGGGGNDVLIGGTGSDKMQGGTGNDTYFFTNGDVIVESSTLPSEIDTVVSANSYRLGNNLENLQLTGSANINATGNNLNNTLLANVGNNVLNGGAGNDTLTGGDGADTLVGGNGQDSLNGGTGKDTFDFDSLSEMGTNSASCDVITDFVSGEDQIDLSTLDANTITPSNDAFSATLVSAFSAPGELIFSDGILYGNTDADLATVEFAIALTGVSTLAASDLLL